jgi:Na+/proline symporter
MFRRIVQTFIVTAIFCVALATAEPAWAAPPDPSPTAQLSAIIGNITGWIVGMLVGVATLFVTYGGARRMSSNGDPSEIEKANSIIRNGLIGYALAILAPILLALVQGWIKV